MLAMLGFGYLAHRTWPISTSHRWKSNSFLLSTQGIRHVNIMSILSVHSHISSAIGTINGT